MVAWRSTCFGWKSSIFSSLPNTAQELNTHQKVTMAPKSIPNFLYHRTTALETRADNDLSMELVKTKLLD